MPRRVPTQSGKPQVVLLVGAAGDTREAEARRLMSEGHLVVQADPAGALAYLSAARSDPGSVQLPGRVLVLPHDPALASHLEALLSDAPGDAGG